MNCQVCGTSNRPLARFCAACGNDLHAKVFSSRYLVVRQMTEGGMGAIYLANDLRLANRICVIKQNLERSRESWKQFKSETQILAKLSHPNLVQVFDYFEDEDNQYLVMEYISGENLEEIAKSTQKPFSEIQVLKWARTLCDVLKYLHTRTPPIFHLDIKPQNIKLQPDGRLVLMDFGIAREGPGGTDTMVLSPSMSHGYSSPEQYTGEIDARSDIYSLGATLFFLLSLQHPLPPFNRIQSPITSGNFQSIQPNLKPATVAIITTAMALSPSQRYESARKMLKAVDAALGIVVNTETNPSASSIHRNVQIPLSSTLAQASEATFLTTRNWLLTKVVNMIMSADRDMVEAVTILLRGQKGYGSTTIAAHIKRRIPTNIGLVVRIRLPERAPIDDWIPILSDLLSALKFGSGSLAQRLQRKVHEYHEKFVIADDPTGERQEHSEFELSLPEISDPTGSVKIGGGGIRVGRDQSSVATVSTRTEKERLRRLQIALKELIAYLVSNHVKVVLILDRVLDAESFNLLRPLTTMGGLFIVTLVEKSRYDLWIENSASRELVYEFGKYSQYVPCLWDLPKRLIEQLTRNIPQASDIPELKYFLKYLQLKGRGAPDLVIRSMWPFYKDVKRLHGVQILRNLVVGQVEERPIISITADDLDVIYRASEIYDQVQALMRNILIPDVEMRETVGVTYFALADHIFEESTNRVLEKQDVLNYAQKSLGLTEVKNNAVDEVIKYFGSMGKIKID